MPPPNLVALGSWVAATCVATAVCWAGVAAVTTDVTGEHGVALPPARVAELATEVAPTTSTTPAPAPTTTTSTTVAPTTPTTAAPVVSAAVTTTTSTTTSTTVPTRSATFADEGGVLVVSCQGDAATLDSARPSDGYALEVRESGPDLVKVAFTSDADRSVLGARCMDGTPTQVMAQQPPEHRRRFNGAGSAPRQGWAPQPRS